MDMPADDEGSGATVTAETLAVSPGCITLPCVAVTSAQKANMASADARFILMWFKEVERNEIENDELISR